MPKDDSTASGGGIATTSRPVFAQFTAAARLALVSSGTDTRTATIEGRLSSGAIATENVALNGTTEVLSANTYERILRVTLSATAATTVTLRQGAGGTTIATIPANETQVTLMFYDSASEASAVNRYEKFFWRNSHASLTLNNARVTLTGDPAARIRIALATAKNDTGSVTNRRTSPGLTFSDDGVALTVPGGTLEAGSAIGVWVEQGLPANDAPQRTTFTTQLSGTSI
jgi:hypothetical protein